jgi:Tol biopolymer transport system component
MGEVYRARDTRLDRDVAIKVSATEFSERFSREARSIAALNHSNVCHLYDVGPNYLVLEFVEGENLTGPMSWDDALPIVRQLIDGIEAAHEKNIIHRDLKTANIRITPEGVVKILDFGLAKAAEPESMSDPAHSPTFTMGATQAGVILGTAAYMPPEQAKGKAADRRSDIWSFGVVVYELLVGKTPFEADNTVEILGAVINREPDWSRVPPQAQRLLRWCLEKDRRKRLAAISDARMLLEDNGSTGTPVATATRATWLWPMAVAALMLLAAASAYGWWRAPRPVARPLMRLSVDVGPEALTNEFVSVVLSPDGSRIVFTGRGNTSGTQQLFTRRLDQQQATRLGTEFASVDNLFYSPNGEWVGLFTNQGLMKVAAQGGSAIVIAELADFNGASWGEDDNIVIGSLNGLMTVPAAGGAVRALTPGAGIHVYPQVLPGAQAVLFNAAGGETAGRLDNFDINVLVLATRETKTLIKGGYWPRYVATAGKTGHLVYTREGTLFGVAFDPSRLEVRGTPTPLVNDVAASGTTGFLGNRWQYSISDAGTFVYLGGRGDVTTYPIQWLDAGGRTAPLVTQPGIYGAPRLSPDGTRLAYTADGSKGGDVWVYDIGRDTPTQLTFTGPGFRELAWAPDSRHLVFGDGTTFWWMRADGSGQPLKLADQLADPRPVSVAPDGRLAFSSAPGGLPDVWTLPLDMSDPDRPRPGKAEPFLVERAVVEVDPAFSPDGRFLAHASNESGVEEVFVRPFPGPGGKWKVSTAGGKFPAWSRTTRELFFLGGDDRVMVASYSIDGDSFRVSRPRVFSPTVVRRDGVRQSFDVSPDGKRVVVFPKPEVEQAPSSLHATFLVNFFDEVRRRIPRP